LNFLASQVVLLQCQLFLKRLKKFCVDETFSVLAIVVLAIVQMDNFTSSISRRQNPGSRWKMPTALSWESRPRVELVLYAVYHSDPRPRQGLFGMSPSIPRKLTERFVLPASEV
jgi:hypothetical protein